MSNIPIPGSAWSLFVVLRQAWATDVNQAELRPESGGDALLPFCRAVLCQLQETLWGVVSDSLGTMKALALEMQMEDPRQKALFGLGQSKQHHRGWR